MSPSSPSSHLSPPSTPPALHHPISFLSLSPTPPRKHPLPLALTSTPCSLGAPIDLSLDYSATSPSFDFDLSPSSILSPTMERGRGILGSRNPFLEILIAQRSAAVELQQSLSPTSTLPTSSESPSQDSQDSQELRSSPGTSPTRAEVEEKEEDTRERIIYDGSSLHSSGGGDFSIVLEELVQESRDRFSVDEVDLLGEEAEWEEEEEELGSTELESGTTDRKEEAEPSTTPVLVVTPSYPDQTPRPSRTTEAGRRKSIHTSSSPLRSPRRQRRTSTIAFPTHTSSRYSLRHSPRSPASIASRRSSIAPTAIQGFTLYPTSPLSSRLHSPTIISSPRKKNKSKNLCSKSKERVRPPPRPIRKTAEGFDAEALDLFFGVTKSIAKARKGEYEEIARKEGVLRRGARDEEEEWRKVEEFRGLLDRGAERHDQDWGESCEEEEADVDEPVLHIRHSTLLPNPSSTTSKNLLSPPTTLLRSRHSHSRRQRARKPRPPPLDLSHANNSFTSSSNEESSSFSPDTPPHDLDLDSPISISSCPSTSSPEVYRALESGIVRSPLDPLSREILRRGNRNCKTDEPEVVVAGVVKLIRVRGEELRVKL
ncbi:hypothetical protein JCM16303_001202 [Sporobolomyces ruberrimus]